MVEINDEIRQIVHRFLREVVRSGIHLENAYIFGSYAKGVANPYSDIDVAVISSDLSDDRYHERLRLMEIAGAIDSRIEPAPFNFSTFTQDNPVAWEVLKTGILMSGVRRKDVNYAK